LTHDDFVVDLKTTEDASPEEFAKSCANYRYHVQDPFYRDGLAAVKRKPRAFVFIAVEKKAPHAVGVYVLRAEDVELGRMQYRANLNRYAECLQSGKFPAYSEKVESLALPAWYVSQGVQRLAA
jgi:exodeoxyribonuclease VIII